MFDRDEGGHPEAARLLHWVVDAGIHVRVPYHALFEISASFKRKNQLGAVNTYMGVNENNPLHLDSVAVDADFFSRYFDPALPYLRAGDSLFLAMAKKDAATLITEDKAMYEAAQTAGIDVCRIDEFLTRIADGEQT